MPLAELRHAGAAVAERNRHSQENRDPWIMGNSPHPGSMAAAGVVAGARAPLVRWVGIGRCDGGPRPMWRCSVKNTVFIPAMLLGERRDVRRRCRRYLKRVANVGRWVPDQDFLEPVPVSQATRIELLFVTLDPPGAAVVRLPLFWEELINAVLASSLGTQPNWAKLRRLTLDGLDVFWFALASLAGWPESPDLLGPDRDRFNALALGKLLRWWPHLHQVGPKFSLGGVAGRWPRWGDRAIRLAGHLAGDEGADGPAVRRLQRAEPSQARQEIESILARLPDRCSEWREPPAGVIAHWPPNPLPPVKGGGGGEACG
jgi:hypothetical protein